MKINLAACGWAMEHEFLIMTIHADRHFPCDYSRFDVRIRAQILKRLSNFIDHDALRDELRRRRKEKA